MNGDLQYDYIEHLHGREAADQWLQKKKLEEIRKQNIINQYAPPLVTPDQMVRAAQKSMGTIPGGLLSEEGPGQMVPLTEEQRIMDERERALAEAYTTPVPSQQDMWKQNMPAFTHEEIYAQAPPEGVGGGWQSGLSHIQGYPIPFDHPSIAGTSVGVTSHDLMGPISSYEGPESGAAQVVSPLYGKQLAASPEYFGNRSGTLDTGEEAHKRTPAGLYGYDQFLRQKGLLSDTPPPSPVEQISPTPHTPGGGMLSDKSGWQKDKLFAASEGQLSKDKGWDADRMRLLFDLYKQTQDDEW